MSRYIMPILILIIITYSYNKCNIYDSFINGIKDGIKTCVLLFPPILAMIFSSHILISSGFINVISNILKPIFNLINFPSELFPFLILKPISGNASLSFLINIFKTYGIDSNLSLIGSIIQASTDTSIYIISLYLGTINIKKTSNIYIIGVLINIISIILSIIIVNIFY